MFMKRFAFHHIAMFFINLQRLSGQKGDATAYIKVYIFYFHKFLNAGEHSSYDSLVTYYSFQKKKIVSFSLERQPKKRT